MLRLRSWFLDAAILLPLIGLALYRHFFWLSQFHVAAEEDHALHLAYSAAYRAVLLSPLDVIHKLAALWTWPGDYPPAVYLTTALGNLLFGVGTTAAAQTLAPYIVLAIVAGYVLGYQAAGRATAAAAAALVASDPVLLYSERQYWLDMPLAALVLASLALLVHCRGFERRGYSLALGVFLGFGFLVKFTFEWYLVLPLVWFSRGVWNRPLAAVLVIAAASFLALAATSASWGPFVQTADSIAPLGSLFLIGGWTAVCAALWLWSERWLVERARNFCGCVCLAGFICGPWILVNLWVLRERWRMNGALHVLAVWQSCLTCWRAVPPAVLLLGVAGAVAAVVWRQRRPWFGPLLLAYGSGLLLTVLTLAPFLRYMAPLGVLVSVMAVAWVPRNRWAQGTVLSMALFFTWMNLADGSLSLPEPRHHRIRQMLANFVGNAKARWMDAAPPIAMDYEPAARDLLARLPAAAHTIYVVDPNGTVGTPMQYLFYHLEAVAAWQGRVLSVVLMSRGGLKVTPSYAELNRASTPATGADPNISLQAVDFFAEVRTRTLAHAYGLPPDPYAYPPRNAAPPDAVVLPVAQPPASAQEWFHASYTAVFSSRDLTLLERVGVGGRAAVPLGPELERGGVTEHTLQGSVQTLAISEKQCGHRVALP